MQGGAIDGTSCFNDQETFTFQDWDSVEEEDIVRVPHERIAGRYWCLDKASLRNWFVERSRTTNPSTGADWTPQQIQFLQGFQQSLRPNPLEEAQLRQERTIQHLDEVQNRLRQNLELDQLTFYEQHEECVSVNFVNFVHNPEPSRFDQPTEEAYQMAKHYYDQTQSFCNERAERFKNEYDDQWAIYIREKAMALQQLQNELERIQRGPLERIVGAALDAMRNFLRNL